jgi:MoaA/NifB/PqqE/SkfB family radical SAM enzyme
MSDTLCKYPFNSVSILDSVGTVGTCCTFGRPPIPNNNIHNNFESILNNQSIISLRKSMIQGEKNSFCNVCWESEKNTGNSFRKVSLKSITKNDDYSEKISFSNIYHMNIFLGNKCNLACRMCSHHSSSLIAKQMKITHPTLDIPIELNFDDITQKRILEFIDNCDNLENIHMYGGEPLINDFYYNICSHLISTNKSKNIRLHLSTNLQIDIDKNSDLANHFKKINLTVSIDGSNETYEYIRWPGKWDKVKNNMSVLYDRNIEFGTNIVVQNLNIDNLTDLIKDLNLYKSNISYNNVRGNNFIKIIPSWVIEKELDKLQKIDITNNGSINTVTKMLKSELELSKNLSIHEVSFFFAKQKQMDLIRNQNLFKIKPHFLELANKFNIEPW